MALGAVFSHILPKIPGLMARACNRGRTQERSPYCEKALRTAISKDEPFRDSKLCSIQSALPLSKAAQPRTDALMPRYGT